MVMLRCAADVLPTSTQEKRLASIEFCRVCRRVPLLHVLVYKNSPSSLWSPREAQIHPNKRSSKYVISERMPAERALRLTWDLPVEFLAQKAAVEFWAWCEGLQLQGPASRVSLAAVVWPASLQQLSLSFFNEPIVGIVWPTSNYRSGYVLISLSLELPGQPLCSSYRSGTTSISPSWELCGRPPRFNQPIAGVVWPVSLRQLSLEGNFNPPIVGVVWPASLQQLSFGGPFNQPIFGVVWVEDNFNQPIAGVVWPASLRQLSFGGNFNQPIVGVVWPPPLQQLSFGENFNQPIVEVVWPASLEQLSFGDSFNQSVAEAVWPASLRSVDRCGVSLLENVSGRDFGGTA